MKTLRHLEEAVDFIFSELGNELRMATPLGLGKPNELLNQVYNRVKAEPEKKLTLLTALSLDIPSPKTDIEKAFVTPFFSRHFGDDYERLDYLKDIKSKNPPENITVHEFYFQAGSLLHSPVAQRNYISLNYTHVAQHISEMKVNVVLQLIARSPDGKNYSLSCNPDLTLDVVDLYKKNNQKLLMIGVVHPDLPFLGGDAEVEESFFSAIVDTGIKPPKLFALPRTPVHEVDHLIGLHASRLIEDEGTLQIGIGSLSDALVTSTLLRHQNNSLFKKTVQHFDELFSTPPKEVAVHHDIFRKGLYGTSEMLMDGFMHLRKAGILIREIFDHDEKLRRYLHGAFFLGSKDFYKWLQTLRGTDYQGLSMTRVSKVNDLYDEHEMALRRQRKNARFFNTTMKVSLLGEAASETLEDGSVISGVGGQYNFVAMSHELPDSHSVLLLKSTRSDKGKRSSNISWSVGHFTIPRHLRDIVVTEYGIASLKGQSDEECIKRLICIADAEFQKDLADEAKNQGKLARDWRIPKSAQRNTAENIRRFTENVRREGLFQEFPLGSDFTPEEEKLQRALLHLKELNGFGILRTLMHGLRVSRNSYAAEIERMKFVGVPSWKVGIYQQLLLGALAGTRI